MALEKHECKKMTNDWTNDWEEAIPWLPECSYEIQADGNCQATRPFHDRFDNGSNKVPWNIQNCVVGKDKNSMFSNVKEVTCNTVEHPISEQVG